MTEYTQVDSMQDKVLEFHVKFGLDAPVGLTALSSKTAKLRKKLIEEESQEACDAIDEGTLTDIAKELADIMYVALGTAVSMGIDLEHVFDLVHRSNMSKLNKNGKPLVREDGKILKGPNYYEPQLVEHDLIGLP
jgi:predicted HAD superfamily Cof-like phosphohydrolase